ncbi:MAG: phosphatase PAP2 family protein [Planctomycetaceae bacterium]
MAGLWLACLAGCRQVPIGVAAGSAPSIEAVETVDRVVDEFADLDDSETIQAKDDETWVRPALLPASEAESFERRVPEARHTRFRPQFAYNQVAGRFVSIGDDETGDCAGTLVHEDDDAVDAWDAEDEPPCFTFRDDCRELLPTLWADTCSVFTWENAIVLGAAAGGTIALREHADGDVREYTAEFPLRWGTGSQTLRNFGEFSYQLPVLFGLYGISMWGRHEKLHEFSKAVICAYGISAVATVAVKGVTDTQRPTDQYQDGRWGFPSYHASSTFCIAAVADEYYGWPVGLPCYVLAGLVGWSRIDQREHDLSDVFFGSVLGFVIGKSVAGAHLERYGNYRVYPYYDPVVRGVGFTLSTTY